MLCLIIVAKISLTMFIDPGSWNLSLPARLHWSQGAKSSYTLSFHSPETCSSCWLETLHACVYVCPAFHPLTDPVRIITPVKKIVTLISVYDVTLTFHEQPNFYKPLNTAFQEFTSAFLYVVDLSNSGNSSHPYMASSARSDSIGRLHMCLPTMQSFVMPSNLSLALLSLSLSQLDRDDIYSGL